jgi:hypothetical protein
MGKRKERCFIKPLSFRLHKQALVYDLLKKIFIPQMGLKRAATKY